MKQLRCINADPLEGNVYGPALVKGNLYEVKEIIIDSKGHLHYDVGLKSVLNYVRSYETKEELPRGNEIHWCHPSRFEEA
jgi:hypothetical protein